MKVDGARRESDSLKRAPAESASPLGAPAIGGSRRVPTVFMSEPPKSCPDLGINRTDQTKSNVWGRAKSKT